MTPRTFQQGCYPTSQYQYGVSLVLLVELDEISVAPTLSLSRSF